MKQTAIPDVRQFIDEQPLSRYQLLVALMCGALVFMDGFDAQAMGFVAPALTAQLHITRAALGPVISIGLFGMMIGALVGGPVADRFGRKPVLVACSFAFGALYAADRRPPLRSQIADHLPVAHGSRPGRRDAERHLAHLRVHAEEAPRHRGDHHVLRFFDSERRSADSSRRRLISRFGWQSVFVVGGIFPIVIGVVALVALPESIRFLLIKGGDRAEGDALSLRIAPESAPFGRRCRSASTSTQSKGLRRHAAVQGAAAGR